jgi:hypothetical protein
MYHILLLVPGFRFYMGFYHDALYSLKINWSRKCCRAQKLLSYISVYKLHDFDRLLYQSAILRTRVCVGFLIARNLDRIQYEDLIDDAQLIMNKNKCKSA